MKFSQRGLMGESQSHSLDMGYETVTQRYRGQRWKYLYPRHMRHANFSLSKHCLIDSPVLIHKGSENKVCPISTKPTTTIIVNEVNQIHLQNVCRNLERRLKKAQLQGDEWLINLLEKEFQDMGELCIIYS